MLVYGKYITCHGLGTLREGSETPTLLVRQSGMGWDILWVRCHHRSKDCSKAHHLPSRASTFWVGRVIPKNNLHHDVKCKTKRGHILQTRVHTVCTLLRINSPPHMLWQRLNVTHQGLKMPSLPWASGNDGSIF